MTFLVSRVGKLRPDWSECGLGGGAAYDWSAPDHSDYNGLVTHNQYWADRDWLPRASSGQAIMF